MWLVKDRKGQISGPYTERGICLYIDQGKFQGRESISSYPAGNWKPISAHSVFYEKILSQISKSEKLESSNQKTSFSSSGDDSDEYIQPTLIIGSKKSPQKKKKIKISLSEKFKQDIVSEEGFGNVIEREAVKSNFLNLHLIKSLKLPALVIFFIFTVVFGMIYIKQSERDTVDRVRLLSPQKKQPGWSDEEIKSYSKKAILSYFKGTVSQYLSAQRDLVEILESNPDKLEFYQYLCLIYLELWPFAYQDAKDKSALKNTLNLIGKNSESRHHPYFNLCQSVKALIDLKPEKALFWVNDSLNNLNRFSPIFLYYIKAMALKGLNRQSEAMSYLESISKLRPEWLAPYMLSGEILYEQKKYDLAANFYQKILSLFPKHSSAGLRMGILEYNYFKKPDKSKERLSYIFLNLKDLILPEILAEAYVVLTNIYLQKNDKKKSLEYANKAYALDPENPEILSLKSQLGEGARFEDVKIQVRGLIYKGDILVNRGNCPEAQRYFKKAYESEKNANALAAFKIAECYWKYGASGQAILWLKRSINSDLKMLDSYFLLARYFSEIYDFKNARDILNAVKSQSPSSYDFFKAYALLSFRQKNYRAAVSYAEKSLESYVSDVEIYILLSQAYRALGQSHKAFSYAEKALYQSSSVEAQITYALALDSTYGPNRAEGLF